MTGSVLYLGTSDEPAVMVVAIPRSQGDTRPGGILITNRLIKRAGWSRFLWDTLREASQARSVNTS